MTNPREGDKDETETNRYDQHALDSHGHLRA